MKRWWHSLFPPPLSDSEAQVRAHAIGAFWGLAIAGIVGVVGLVLVLVL